MYWSGFVQDVATLTGAIGVKTAVPGMLGSATQLDPSHRDRPSGESVLTHFDPSQ
jgi:hypothetical protein